LKAFSAMKIVVALGVILAILTAVWAVDRTKFRTCGDTRFCRQYRNYDPSSLSEEQSVRNPLPLTRFWCDSVFIGLFPSSDLIKHQLRKKKAWLQRMFIIHLRQMKTSL
jgi:hypothetical protein